MQIEQELQELRRRAGIDLTEAPIVWRLLRQGVSPYSVLAELGIVGPRRGS